MKNNKEYMLSYRLVQLTNQTDKIFKYLSSLKKGTFISPVNVRDILNAVIITEEKDISLLNDTYLVLEEINIKNLNFIKDIDTIKELLTFYFNEIEKVKNEIQSKIKHHAY